MTSPSSASSTHSRLRKGEGRCSNTEWHAQGCCHGRRTLVTYSNCRYNNFKTYFKNNPPRQHEVPTEKQAQDNGYKNVVQAYLHDNIGNFDACDLGEPHSSHCDHRC
jgi:hypothetical protein